MFRILEKHAKHVVDTCSSDTDNPREALARVHALLIYQIIRLFDGDVRQRNQAELAMPTLVAWNLHLRKLRDEMNPHGENGLLNPPTNWEVSAPVTRKRRGSHADGIRNGSSRSLYDAQSC